MNNGIPEMRNKQDLIERLKTVWADMFNVSKVEEDDDFFNFGGDSFKAAIMSVRIKSELGIDVQLTDIIMNPTISKLSDFIQSMDCTQENNTIIKKAEEREYYPISWAQRGVFILHKQFSSIIDVTYNLPGYIIIDGDLDIKMLESAFQSIIRRHETLRTSFHFFDGEPMQRVWNDVDFKIDYIEKTDLEPEQLIQNFTKPFDISIAPLIRVSLVRMGINQHLMFFDMHHLVSDGVSIGILIKELASIIGEKEQTELKFDYKDFSVWQNEYITTVKVKEQEKFWLDLFSGEIPLLNLPLDYSRPNRKCFDGERVNFYLGKELSKKLSDFVYQNGMTLYMVLIAAYYVLLHKYTDQEDIIVGTSSSGRNQLGTENMIGMFVNTIPLRNFPKGHKMFSTFLHEVKECILNSLKNQDYQYLQLVTKAGIEIDLTRNPLFDAMFEFQDMDIPEININDIKFNRYEYRGKGAKFDILFETVNRDNEIILTIEYNTKLFKKDTVKWMADHYINILNQVVRDMDIQLSYIDILSNEEKELLCTGFNNTAREYDYNKSISELFEEQVEKSPQKTALVYKGQEINYIDLNNRVNQLAEILINSGVEANHIVGIMLHRSIETIVSIFGILRAGAAYLPIDPNYPDERIRYMLEDSGAKLLLVDDITEKKFTFSGQIINLVSVNSADKHSTILKKRNSSHNLAYVIYTSGSTGKPKGVMIDHKAVHNFIMGITDRINFDLGKKILAVTTISFDIFVLETILPLVRGLTVVIADEEQHNNPKLLNKLIIESEIDILQTTPSRMRLLISEESCKTALSRLTDIILGGEVFPLSLLQDIKKYSSTRIFNMYGPTETTVWSTIKELTDTTEVNIGSPIANTQIFIVNKNCMLQPVGIPGEMCISGDGVARGYINEAELTEEKFVSNTFSKSKRMYRTGDLAKWLNNGEIEFLGRLDHQVKIRGYRIELEEIQTHLLSLDSIKEAIVVDMEDISGSKYLCVYIVSDDDINIDELRNSLMKYLPEYMIPSKFFKLDKLPMTPNGKVNRKLLPQFEVNLNTGNQYIAPENELQKKMVQIWESILQRQKIGINDDFFKLGGHSLLAIKLEVDMENEGIEVEYSEIYKYRTINELSKFIENGKK